jgi:hypothetical protein
VSNLILNFSSFCQAFSVSCGSRPNAWHFLLPPKGVFAMTVPITTLECLLKFKWVKLPRNLLPKGKGGDTRAVAATRVAFRPGQARYCGHTNDVELASWVGGIVGLKSILGVKSREKALAMMDRLAELGYSNSTIQ